MLATFKRLALGLGLILLAALFLLGADWGSRHKAPKIDKTLPAIAVLQFSSNPIMDEFCQGAIAEMADGGFVDGKNIRIVHFNAEGDVATANLVAKQITDGSYKLIITASTICLQAVGTANRNGARTPHIFGAVTDPFIAGVGISHGPPQEKPPYLTGMGTFQPIERIFRQARALYPSLKTVGVVWNASEVNSEACVKKARLISKELGITLLEASVEKTSDVNEAAASLVGRGVQAIWTGGDATVNTAIDTVVKVASKNKIPVFSNIYGHAKRGTLFDLGANYEEVGRAVGAIAVRVLRGESPADIEVIDLLPEKVMLNYQTLQQLRDKWHFTDDLIARANDIIGPDGLARKNEKFVAPATAPAHAPAATKKH